MKRILSLVLALALLLSVCAIASAETVGEALAAAAKMTNEELYEKAKEEAAAGAQLNFYSTTSFAEKAAANFMNDYPELAGKVVYAEIDDKETYTILTNTIGSGVKDSADMALTQNGPDLKTYLLDEGLTLIMLTSEKWNARLEEAYEARYGKAWEAGKFESAALQWIDGFLANVNYTYTSASKMAAGIASGAPGNMGLFVFSKLRKVDEADRGNLTVVQFENEVEGFSGFMYPIYATVCKDTECPYTCALFINYLLSEQGFAGPKSWNSSQGYYSPNKTIAKPEGIEDEPYEYWSDRLVIEDLEYIDEHYIDVYEFIATRVG